MFWTSGPMMRLDVTRSRLFCMLKIRVKSQITEVKAQNFNCRHFVFTSMSDY